MILVMLKMLCELLMEHESMAAEFELKCLQEGRVEVEDLEVLHQGDDLYMMNIGSHADHLHHVGHAAEVDPFLLFVVSGVVAVAVETMSASTVQAEVPLAAGAEIEHLVKKCHQKLLRILFVGCKCGIFSHLPKIVLCIFLIHSLTTNQITKGETKSHDTCSAWIGLFITMFLLIPQ